MARRSFLVRLFRIEWDRRRRILRNFDFCTNIAKLAKKKSIFGPGWLQKRSRVTPKCSQCHPRSDSKVAPKWLQSDPNGIPKVFENFWIILNYHWFLWNVTIACGMLLLLVECYDSLWNVTVCYLSVRYATPTGLAPPTHPIFDSGCADRLLYARIDFCTERLLCKV